MNLAGSNVKILENFDNNSFYEDGNECYGF
jgi:hypothetical protein